MVNFKELGRKAKMTHIIKVWGELVDELIEMGPEFGPEELENVLSMKRWREEFMIRYGGFQREINPLKNDEEKLVRR